MTLTPHPIFREKFAYGLGDFASNLYWQTFMLYMTYFYTDIFGLAAAAAATMFLVNRFIDAISDPVMGMVADHTQTRWGRFRPWLLWTCVPFAILGILTFTTPSLNSGGKLVWAYVTFFGMMLFLHHHQHTLYGPNGRDLGRFPGPHFPFLL